ncbi:hypothetical protein BCR44DRAFT_1514679 [Catenaria anguillulae PL171]|uniref:Uncharacterized protein n=1 Tax=Catenaria anguillulae PL171 TaxID=765915 RepID=A0A1Y2HK79_9FUNG|nr:hypothetical protein BCR44DRAFT_1514679 [Catenaria anguillulae PL171]
MHYSSSPAMPPMPAIDQTLALLELQDTILNRIRLESRLWSLRTELAAVEADENQARAAQVEAERAVEEAKKKTERAAEKGRTIKVELRFLTEQIAEFDKEMTEYKAQLVQSAATPEPSVVPHDHDVHPSAAALLMAGAGRYTDEPQQHQHQHQQQKPIGSEYRCQGPSQPIKQEHAHDPFLSHARHLRDTIGTASSPSTPSVVAQHQSTSHTAARAAFESFRPSAMASSSLPAVKPIRMDQSCSPALAASRTDISSWGHPSTGGWDPLASQLSTSSAVDSVPTADQNHPAASATDTDTDDTSTEKPANPYELKSQRLITAVTELTGKEPEKFCVDGRTYFLAGPLAGVFSPSLKDPNKAASAHARKYGCDASGQFREGVRKQGGRWAMTIEAFEDYVLSHLRSPRFIKY